MNEESVLEGTPYVAERRLGRGGMGDVYLARPRAGGPSVVAKVLRRKWRGDATMRRRLRSEGLALARLQHPNLVRVLDQGTAGDGTPYLILERLHGQSLARCLSRRRVMPPREAVPIVVQVLDALAVAHGAGILHRDVKPSNVWLEHGAEGVTAKVLDFGVARWMTEMGDSRAGLLPVSRRDFAGSAACAWGLDAPGTSEGVALGTPRCMSPEQIRCERLTPASDIYAVGLLLYRMLAGRGPFDHHITEERILAAHLADTPPPMASFAQQCIPLQLEEVVRRALAKVPQDRFLTAVDMASVLRGWAAHESLTSAQVLPPRSPDESEESNAPLELQRWAPLAPTPLAAPPMFDAAVAELAPTERCAEWSFRPTSFGTAAQWHSVTEVGPTSVAELSPPSEVTRVLQRYSEDDVGHLPGSARPDVQRGFSRALGASCSSDVVTMASQFAPVRGPMPGRLGGFFEARRLFEPWTIYLLTVTVGALFLLGFLLGWGLGNGRGLPGTP